MILSLAPALTSAALDAALEGLTSRSPDLEGNGSRQGDLRIDLSAVEMVEFGVLAQLLLLAEDACRAGRRLVVDLPASVPGEPSDGDGGAAQRRERCLQLLRTTGFVAAVRMPHVAGAAVDIRGLGDRQQFEAAASSRAAEERQSCRYLPFRWIRSATGEQLHRSEAIAGILQELREIGMFPRDARLVVDAILHELVENVALYGGQDVEPPLYALVGARLGPSGALLDAGELPGMPAEADLPVTESRSIAVRLLVADSGAGLVHRLSPGLPGDAGPDAEGRPWTTGTLAERTIFWAFERWSTSRTDKHSLGLGTRGLWRVLRVVRTNGGAVLIRSSDAFAGYVYGPGGAETLVRTPGLQPVGGTIFDVIMFPQEPARIDAAAGAGLESGRSFDFKWVRVRPESPGQFDKVIDLAQQEHDVIMTVDGWRQQISHEGLTSILDMAARLASPSVVVVVVTGVNPMHLHHAVDAIHHPLTPSEADADQVGDPFLLIDETGEALWCGGPPDIRDLLDSLLRDGQLRISSFSDTASLRRLLVDQARLVVRHTDTVALSVTPADVIQQLQHIAQGILRDALDQDEAGILRGAFRTPTLRLTDRWIYIEDIMRRTIGIATAAFLLIQKLAADVPGAVRRDTELVQVGPVTLQLSQAFIESAGLRGNAVYVMADEFDSPAGVDRIAAATEVILCCDMLLTDNSVRRAISEILSWKAVPKAIVVPIDARLDEGPIEVHGVAVPVTRLVRVLIPAPHVPTDEIVDIDPLLRSPVSRLDHDRDRSLLWDPDAFLAACAEQSRIIGLGHIERPAHGHFTVYLDAGKVIDLQSQNSFGKEAADRMTSAALEWLTEDRLSSEGRDQTGEEPPRCVVVYYPGLPDDYAGRIARLICKTVAPHLGPGGTVEPRPVPREVAGSHWAFPEALDKLPPGCEVILTDWGCINAATIMQLIRLTSEAGASKILGLVMLSQLQAHEERALTMIRSVGRPPEGRRWVADGQADFSEGAGGGRPEIGSREPVPTQVRFLTALGISAFPRGNCPLCQLIAQLTSDETSGLLPSPIARHARRLASELTPVAREEAVSREADAFGAPVRTPEAVAYIRFRGDLVAALRSTSRRQAVADHVAALAGQPPSLASHAAIRLLAAERQWIKLPPLRFADSSRHLAQVAHATACDTGVHEQLRLQAVVVLANVAPDLLVAQLPRLWASALDNRTLLLHIVYHLNHIVRRPAGEIPVALPELRTQITACKDASQFRYSSEYQAEEMEWLLKHVLDGIGRAEVEQLNLSAEDAWARLRHYYLYWVERHCVAEAALIRLRLQMEEPRPQGMPPDWKLTLRTWRTIDNFLQVEVLPYLRPLSRLLLGEFGERTFTERERAWLHADEAVRRLTKLSSDLHDLSKPDRAVNELVMGNVNSQLEDLQVTILSGEDEPKLAKLASFISACPTAVVPTVQDCIRHPSNRPGRAIKITFHDNGHDEFVSAFCHEELLHNTIMQLIDNVDKHRDPEPDAAPAALDVELTSDAAFIMLDFRNTGTVLSARPGRGIIERRRELDDFGAGLEIVQPSGQWTFEVRLRLVRWTAAG